MVEGIKASCVTRWLADQVPALTPPVTFALIEGGHSNLTYRCEDAAGELYVLRRPPLGHILESAHDMGREHRIIRALGDTVVPVPPEFGLCTDPEVNELPFFVMRFIEGLVPIDSVAAADIPLADRGPIGEHAVAILCDLHAVDPDRVGLGDLGRKEAYVARQLSRWSKQWEATKTEENPDIDTALRLLQERIPAQQRPGIVHGDFRLGNMIVGDGKVQALLDWELCTLGDPLADLGYLLNWWMPAEEVDDIGPEDQAPTAVPGFISRDDICRLYEAGTGFDLEHVNYYRAFSNWRLAAISQGVYKRFLVGAMGDQELDMDRAKRTILRRAREACELLAA